MSKAAELVERLNDLTMYQFDQELRLDVADLITEQAADIKQLTEKANRYANAKNKAIERAERAEADLPALRKEICQKAGEIGFWKGRAERAEAEAKRLGEKE